jgi:hypothetical protein
MELSGRQLDVWPLRSWYARPSGWFVIVPPYQEVLRQFAIMTAGAKTRPVDRWRGACNNCFKKRVGYNDFDREI